MQRSKRSLIILSFILLCFLHDLNGREIQVQDKLSRTFIGVIHSIELGKQSFIPIQEFAQLLSIPTERNDSQKSISLAYKQSRFTITAHSPYIRSQQGVYQMRTEARFPNREFYVPLYDLINCLKSSGINTIDFDESNVTLYVQTRSANIVRMSSITREDTAKIILHTTKVFRDDDITTKKEDEWVYINVDGGVIDIKNKLGFERIPQVFEFFPLQINPDQARLSLHLAPNVSEAQVKCNEEASEITITLIAKSVVPSAVLTDLQREREKWKIDTIILDPGHGGRDPGAVGPSRIYEKNIVLNVAKATKEELVRQLDVNVIMTRDRDTFIPLKGRTQKANEAGGKLFVSFHVDANRVKSLRGHTVYFLGPAKTDDAREVAQFENSAIKFEESQNEYADLSDMSFILAANAQNSYNKESQDFASIINEEIIKGCGSRSHGVRQAGFYVLYGASMPNILIEMGFMTNSYDRNKLITGAYQSSLARAITAGIIRFKEKYESINF